MRNKKTFIILPIVVIAIVIAAIMMRGSVKEEFQHDSGYVFGTVYNITYQAEKNMKEDIEKVLQSIDNSLSPFNKNSVITAVNDNKDVTLDSLFLHVFTLAAKVHEDTQGAFDITVAPLVNAWGFGFKSGIKPTEHVIDSLRNIVGFEKVKIEGGKVQKSDPRIMLDCSAIAKGYAVDKVAEMLRNKGVKNFMVEIGGEVVTAGMNSKNAEWRIGVSKPNDDSLNIDNELQTILTLTDKAMATSGNYRNFYYRDGKKYAHTINPKTGYPIQHSLLSATVIAADCATADAYATSFMVLGIEEAKKVLERHPEMMAYFIYSKDDGTNAVWFSPALKEMVEE